MTLMKGIKPVITEKHHLDKRVESLYNKVVEISGFQDFVEAKININGCTIKSSSTEKVLSFKTLVEGKQIDIRQMSIKECLTSVSVQTLM